MEQGRAWMEAAKGGDTGTLKALLSSNPNLITYQGQGTSFSFTAHSALHWAAAKGHVGAVRWLLQQGADAGARNNAGATPLHAALSNNQAAAATCLVLEGLADIHARDELGDSARDVAVRAGNAGLGPLDLDRAAAIAALKACEPTAWANKAMLRVLALCSGGARPDAVERGELITACQKLLAKYPARIMPVRPPAVQAGSPAAPGDGGTKGSAAAPTPAPAQAAPHPAGGVGPEAGPVRGAPAAPAAAPAATHASGDGAPHPQGVAAPAPSSQKEAGGKLGAKGATPPSTSNASEQPHAPHHPGRGGAGSESEGDDDSGDEQDPGVGYEKQVEAARLSGNTAFGQGDYKKAGPCSQSSHVESGGCLWPWHLQVPHALFVLACQ